MVSEPASSNPPAKPGPDPHLKYAERERDWYAKHAPRERYGYQTLEIAIVVLGAAVPVAGALNAAVGVMSIIGAGVVVATGLRQVFRWQENWIGFIDAQMQLEYESALYRLLDAPYDGPDRGARLDRAVPAIKRAATDRWRARRSSVGDSAADAGQRPVAQTSRTGLVGDTEVVHSRRCSPEDPSRGELSARQLARGVDHGHACDRLAVEAGQ